MSYTMISHIRDSEGKNIIKFNLVDLKGARFTGNYEEVKGLIERHGTAYVDNLGLKGGQVVGTNGHLDRYPYTCENGLDVNENKITVIAKANEQFICSDCNGVIKKVSKANLARLAKNGIVTNAASCASGVRSINGSFLELEIAKKTKPITLNDKLKQADELVKNSRYKFPLDRLKEELRKMTEIYIGEINKKLDYYLPETLAVNGKDSIVYESNIFINSFCENPVHNRIFKEKDCSASELLNIYSGGKYSNESEFKLKVGDWVKAIRKDEVYIPAITLYMYVNSQDEDGPDAEINGVITDEDAWITFCKCGTSGQVKMVFDSAEEMERAYRTAALQYVEAFRCALDKVARAAKNKDILNKMSKIPVNKKIQKLLDID